MSAADSNAIATAALYARVPASDEAPDEAALRKRLTQLEALAHQRAQAVQSAVLAKTAVAPERLFITTERSAALAADGKVRMELKLE